MRKLLFVALLVLIIFPMSVAALGNNTNVTPIGNVIQPMFSIDINMPMSPPNWGLAYGENSWFTIPGTGPYPPLPAPPSIPPGMLLSVTGHAMQGVNYTITASDTLQMGKPPATKGFMAEYRFNFSNVPPLPPALANVTSQGWVPGGKVLIKPLRLTNITIIGSGPWTPVYKYYNLTGTDPVLFTGVGDTVPGAVTGPGTTFQFDINQQITLTDTGLYQDPIPPMWMPGITPETKYRIHNYMLPITFTLTAL